MGFFDDKWDWYDFFVPGSNITPLFGNGVNDIMDAIGIGTQRRAQEYNSAEAEKNRQWQEDMSNTSYQRAMEDIKEAGLNPSMLYASGGASSYVPSGANGSTGIQGSSNIIGQAGMLINSLTNAKSIDQQTTSNIYKNVAKIISKLVM